MDRYGKYVKENTCEHCYLPLLNPLKVRKVIMWPKV